MLPDKSKLNYYVGSEPGEGGNSTRILLRPQSKVISSCTLINFYEVSTRNKQNFLEEMKNFFAPLSKLSLITTG